MTNPADEAAIAVVRRNTEEVQGKGNWEAFDELFADDFVDHTPQPGATPDKAGVAVLYHALRTAFPDFHPDIRWQIAAGELVTTYMIYHGIHTGPILGVAPTRQNRRVRNRRRHESPRRQDHRPLGRAKSTQNDGAARRRHSQRLTNSG